MSGLQEISNVIAPWSEGKFSVLQFHREMSPARSGLEIVKSKMES